VAGPQVSLDIRTKGDGQAAKLIYMLGKRGEDPRPAFRQIIEDLRIAEDRWYETDGSGSWPGLAEATIEKKKRLGQPLTPLVASGDLRRSLEVKRGRGATRSATKTRMRFGTKIWYARFHRLGSKPVPKRDPLLPVDARSRRRMVQDVRDYMLGRSKGRAT